MKADPECVEEAAAKKGLSRVEAEKWCMKHGRFIVERSDVEEALRRKGLEAEVREKDDWFYIEVETRRDMYNVEDALHEAGIPYSPRAYKARGRRTYVVWVPKRVERKAVYITAAPQSLLPEAPGVAVSVSGATYELRDALKGLGFKWDSVARAWTKTIPGGNWREELKRLAEEVEKAAAEKLLTVVYNVNEQLIERELERVKNTIILFEKIFAALTRWLAGRLAPLAELEREGLLDRVIVAYKPGMSTLYVVMRDELRGGKTPRDTAWRIRGILRRYGARGSLLPAPREAIEAASLARALMEWLISNDVESAQAVFQALAKKYPGLAEALAEEGAVPDDIIASVLADKRQKTRH